MSEQNLQTNSSTMTTSAKPSKIKLDLILLFIAGAFIAVAAVFIFISNVLKAASPDQYAIFFGNWSTWMSMSFAVLGLGIFLSYLHVKFNNGKYVVDSKFITANALILVGWLLALISSSTVMSIQSTLFFALGSIFGWLLTIGGFLFAFLLFKKHGVNSIVGLILAITTAVAVIIQYSLFFGDLMTHALMTALLFMIFITNTLFMLAFAFYLFSIFKVNEKNNGKKVIIYLVIFISVGLYVLCSLIMNIMMATGSGTIAAAQAMLVLNGCGLTGYFVGLILTVFFMMFHKSKKVSASTGQSKAAQANPQETVLTKVEK